MRARFAPTPSGQLHIGNLYTALLSWLQARSAGGTFILRMEDIDKPRSKPRWAARIIDDLKWLGIDWDEGPDIGGPYEPYTQSERLALYEAAYRKLQDNGWLYPCYCSRAELTAVASAPHGLSSEGPAYPGTCKSLSADERRARSRTKTPSFRFAVKDDILAVFEDAVFGTVQYAAGAGGDFIVRRADGIFSYQLAVVVDDSAMGVTHVLRGADLLDSTARQLWLYQALGLKAPSFAHVPLLCEPNGERLSKRSRSLTGYALREAGLRPEVLIGHLAAIANLIERPEPMKATELIDGFELSKIGKEPLHLSEATLRSLTSQG